MTNAAESRAKPFAVVLAAGESRRFGQAKQLAVFAGETLVHRAARVARACCGVNTAIVAGYRAQAVIQSANRQCQFTLINDRYAEGMGSSIALVANTIGRAADALLLLLVDQPLITPGNLRSVISAWSGDAAEIVASSYGGVSGPPILLPSATYPELRRLSGDSGAKALLADRRFTVTRVPLGRAGIDIDTPEDLERLRQAAE